MKRYVAISIILLLVACLMAACATENITPLIPQETPLMPPQHVVATQTRSGDISITWDPNSQIGLAGYNIYRSVYREDAFTRMNLLLVPESVYLDETASTDTRYEYRIVCVGIDQRESDYGTATIYNGSTAGGEEDAKITH